MATRAETLAAIDRLATKHERLIARGFLEAVGRIRDVATLGAIEAAFLRGPEAVARLFSDEALASAAGALEQAIGEAALDGARNTAATTAPVPNSRGVIAEFTFNAGNPRLGTFIEQNTTRRIREVSEGVKATIRTVVRQETTAGVNPNQAARRIRDSIGLTERQELAVNNFEKMLRNIENRDADRLARALANDELRVLRDRRYDRTIVAAARRGEPLSEQQISTMVERYRKRYIDYRARTIGRTEAIRSLNGAAREYMSEQVSRGRVDARQVRRFWVHTRDDRTRVDHTKIADLNPDGVGLNEPFETPTGERLMYPGDAGGRPENVINCRCMVYQRVVPFELVGGGAE